MICSIREKRARIARIELLPDAIRPAPDTLRGQRRTGLKEKLDSDKARQQISGTP